MPLIGGGIGLILSSVIINKYMGCVNTHTACFLVIIRNNMFGIKSMCCTEGCSKLSKIFVHGCMSCYLMCGQVQCPYNLPNS